MSTLIFKRLENLRIQMRKRSLNACIIPSSDPHMSEYINDCYKFREYFSGFTGSSGTLFVTLERAYLITDGRYFLQAENELSGTKIKLVRQGIKGEPDIFDLCKLNLKKGEKLFADPTLISFHFAEKLFAAAEEACFGIEFDNNPIIPASDVKKLEFSKVRALSPDLYLKSSKEKLSDIRLEMRRQNADAHIVASLDEIAWILNMRANDIKYTPVFYSFMYIGLDSAHVFADLNAVSDTSDILNKANFLIHDYSDFYEFLKKIKEKSVMLDKKCVNFNIISCLPRGVKIIEHDDPAILLKAIKSSAEIASSKNVHVRDGLAVARFMHYIKTCDVSAHTELSAAEKLEEFRKLSPEYIYPSFDTICAYGTNGAIVHYSATVDSNKCLDFKDALLVDSGGQYFGGTTDITRMFVLGETSEDFKIHYTCVCKSMLRLQNAIFPKNISCGALDILTREPIWKLGLDFLHGTGHGVGHMLSVHEGPQRIHYGNVNSKLLPGMITTDEPGLYIEGKHGIRIENELLCESAFSNEYGEFLKFLPLTVCPIDKDALITSMLDNSDIRALNSYHSHVYESLSKLADEDELSWLAEFCAPIC